MILWIAIADGYHMCERAALLQCISGAADIERTTITKKKKWLMNYHIDPHAVLYHGMNALSIGPISKWSDDLKTGYAYRSKKSYPITLQKRSAALMA